MMKKGLGTSFLFAMLIFSGCMNDEKAQTQEGTRAQILNVSVDLPKKYGWWVVSKDIDTITISVEAENTETVLFWITPTGTETWEERELIGYDKDGSDGWSLTWDFGDRTFHDRIYVQALGSNDRTQDKEIIQVTTETQ